MIVGLKGALCLLPLLLCVAVAAGGRAPPLPVLRRRALR